MAAGAWFLPKPNPKRAGPMRNRPPGGSAGGEPVRAPRRAKQTKHPSKQRAAFGQVGPNSHPRALPHRCSQAPLPGGLAGRGCISDNFRFPAHLGAVLVSFFELTRRPGRKLQQPAAHNKARSGLGLQRTPAPCAPPHQTLACCSKRPELALQRQPQPCL